jgi:hypothetical protein
MQLLNAMELELVTGAQLLPTLDANNDVVMPKEMMIGLGVAGLGLFVMDDFTNKMLAATLGFIAGWAALPAYNFAMQSKASSTSTSAA